MSTITILPNGPQDALKGTDLSPFAPQATPRAGEANPLDDFSKMLEKQVNAVDGDMKAADDMTESFLRGGETSIHEVMIATSKADISFRLMTQVGRKVVEAYQEIMRMQV